MGHLNLTPTTLSVSFNALATLFAYTRVRKALHIGLCFPLLISFPHRFPNSPPAKPVCSGGMVFTFLKARGLGVGSSLVEEDKLDLAKELEEKAKAAGVQIILPSDLVVADAFAADAKTQVVQADAIPDGWMGLDNGPEATKEIQAALKEVKLSPLGVFVFAGVQTE